MPSVSRPVTRTEYNNLVDLVEGMQDMMVTLDTRITDLEGFRELHDLERKMLAPPRNSRSKMKYSKSPAVGSLERRLNALKRGGTKRRLKNTSKTRSR